MSNGVSEIDDPRFFFAKNGKEDAEAELDATLDAFFNEKRFDDNSSACLFPARKAWLQENLNITDFPEVQCQEYDDTIEKLSPTSATLVFPAAHINSPASMFGHTFLRINSKYNSKLLAYAINYAADADPDKENAVGFALKGLFGGYFGKYSLLPYYDKLKEYRDTERRDIWEYDLNLTQEEVMRMVRHIWELNGTKSYYYFFTENCSYNMLWLMEIARPSTHIREHFAYQVIPLESVHATNEEDLIAKEFYRPSKRTILLKYEELIEDQNIHLVKELQEDEKLNLTLLQDNNISTQQKQYIYEAAVEYLEYSFSRNEMKKEKYLDLFYKLSSSRAKLGKGKKLNFPNPQNPLESHRAVKLSIGGALRDSSYYTVLGIRPAYHTLEDPQYGFLRGTQIEFLNIELGATKDSLKIEDLTVLSIKSIAQRTKLFSPFSWRTKFGWDKNYVDTKANFSASVGAGFSWGNKLGYLYMMVDPLYYIADKSAGGIGASFGFDIDKYKYLKTNVEFTQRYYDTGDEQLLISAAQSVNPVQNLQLKVKYEYKEKYILKQKKQEDNFQILLNYYF
ncbi:DUF4105 domain-containing protein [Sulfurimonas microaerophilic]|uniref:Lnb N-terminal periplasmic domain-containing protein n=1 Tax=Sulfurimonas microaerophilic TaxID=3058392 RepID=UPI0027148007|nr:DUF4105 domain-containing protein [Sulfurimonas sp. hsl 1-7]